MGQQQIITAFPSGGPPGTPYDFVAVGDTEWLNANQNGWSQGGTAIVQLNMQPPLSESWSILGWSMTWTMYLYTDLITTPRVGRLGRLIGGISQGGSPTWLGPGSPNYFRIPATPFPNNNDNLAVLWDGSSDPPPAWYQTSVPQLAPNTYSLNLASPLQVKSGDSIFAWLSLTPALAYATMTLVPAATITVAYDDGLPRIVGWGGPSPAN